MFKKIFYSILWCICIVLWGAIIFWKPINYNLPFEDILEDDEELAEMTLPNSVQPLSHRQQEDERLVEMILRIEDKRFFQHFWIDFISLGRAIWHRVWGNYDSGASTIDQQVIKLHEQAYQRSWQQKIHEIGSAVLLQKNGKDAILTTYLNLLPFPYGRTGTQQWCQLLFGRSCKYLTIKERFFLIATYQTGKNPYTQEGFSIITSKANSLCKRWQREEDEHTLCKTESWKPQAISWKQKDKTALELEAWSLKLFPLPEISVYSEEFRKVLEDDMEHTWRGVFDVNITRKINQVLDHSKQRRESIAAKDCCVLVMDSSWNMISHATCRDPNDEEGSFVDGCFAKRQVGSLMKPLVYLYALQALWWDMDDMILDEQVNFELWNGEIYRPQNFDLRYHGEVSLAEALASSLNIPAVKLLHQAGLEGYFWFFNRLRLLAGENKETIIQDMTIFNPERLGLSVALGTYELSPYEVIRVWRLLSPSNETLWWNSQDHERFKTFIAQRQAITKVLSDSSYRIHGFRNPRALDHPGRAIKTGTSRHFVDGWMCGVKVPSSKLKAERKISSSYSSFLSEEGPASLCVWMGNYEGESMKVSGADSAGVLWGLVEEVLSK